MRDISTSSDHFKTSQLSDTTQLIIMETKSNTKDLNSNQPPKSVYEHLPIDSARKQIRLLSLFPVEGLSQPEGSLSVISLYEEPSFEALSYTWGDNNHHKGIKLHGQEYPVTHNLYSALLHLRDPLDIRTLWIDAICIDQSNVLERNHQVGLMKDIYSLASSVQIWLGEEQNNSGLAMKALAALAITDPDQRLCVHTLTPKTIQAISDLFKRPWWSRMWIIQEVALAKHEPNLTCGVRSLPWETVTFAAGCLDALKSVCNYNAAELIERLHNNLGVLWQIRTIYQRDKDVSLRNLFNMSKDACATDPRDRVYALLGLARNIERSRIVVDYTKSISDVYRESIVHSIMANKNLDMLSAFPHTVDFSTVHENAYSLPSWVQDINHLVPALEGGHWPIIGESESPHYSASKGLSTNVTFKNFEVMMAKGIHFDTITDIDFATILKLESNQRLPMTYFRVDELTKMFYGALLSQCSTNGGYHESLYGNGTDCYHVFSGHGPGMAVAIWRTLIANRSAIGMTTQFESVSCCTDEIPAPPIYGKMWDVLMRNSLVPKDFFLEQKSMSGEEARTYFIEPLVKRLQKTLQGRKGFTTKHGFIGIGPDNMDDDDVVAVLFGGEVPFVLRPRGDHYIFLGDCYVHGIMGGELIDLYNQKGENMGGPVLKIFNIH